MHFNLSCCTTNYTKGSQRVTKGFQQNSHIKNNFPPSQKSTKMWVQEIFIYKIRDIKKQQTASVQQDSTHLHILHQRHILNSDFRFNKLPKQRYKYEILKCRFCRVLLLFPKTLWWWSEVYRTVDMKYMKYRGRNVQTTTNII